jgi:hypothetical protein
MRTPLCGLLGSLLLSAALAGVGYAICQGSTYLARSCAGAAEVAATDRQARRSNHLHALWADHLERVHTRAWVESELIAQRMNLFEAAAHFRTLDTQVLDPDVVACMLRQQFPGKSEGERYCRKVIACIRASEELQGLSPSATRRLEAELTARLRRYGTVQLPKR